MTTTTKAEQAAILGRLNTQWNDATPIAWPNAKYPPPSDYAANPDKYDNKPYIQPVVNRQDGFNADVSTARRVRYPGLLTINIRVPIGQGDGAALTLADTAAGIFRNVSFSGITFRASTVRDIGPEDHWYRVQVDCPYWRDSIHS